VFRGTKIVFSSFAASKLKRKIEKEGLKNQYGSKPAGAEAMIHIFQQLRESNPDFDILCPKEDLKKMTTSRLS